MPERLTPGVYVEEVSSGIKPIEGAGTSTAAFLGEAARGVPDTATFITSFGQFERTFGGHRRGSPGLLAQAVQGFFDAGGRRAYVVRVLPSNAQTGVTEVLSSRATDALGEVRDVLQFEARGKGDWAQYLRLHVEPSATFPEQAFNVRLEWSANGSSRTIESFNNVRMDAEHEDYIADVINATSKYVRVTDVFARDFLDAEERQQPPLPEQVPALLSRTLGASETFTVYEDAEYEFRWADGASGAGTDSDDPPVVTIDSATLGAVGASLVNGQASLTAAQLSALITAGLGTDFRVSATTNQVRVEPNVASSAYLVVGPDTGSSFDFSATTSLTLTITIGATPSTITVDSLTSTMTAAELAEALLEAREAGDPEFRAEAAGAALVVSVPANSQGVSLDVSVDAGDPLGDITTLDGSAGTVVDSLNGVDVTIRERLQVGVPRGLAELGFASRAVGLEENSGKHPLLRPAETDDSPVRFVGGSDGTGAPGLTEFKGSQAEGTGLHALDGVEVHMLALPGKNTPSYLSAAMTYGELNDIFVLADGVGSIDNDFSVSADEVRQFVDSLPMRSKSAAIYYPWLKVGDPVGIGRNPTRFVPPSGHMAGIFARTDLTRGVWKSPAGVEATVPNVIDLQHQLKDADQDLLNPIGQNCIRQFPGVGIVSWGARTLSADPEWRYVGVRRTALFLKRSIRAGMRWAVFEPNDQDLWSRIKINITSFMLSLFRQGAFQGTTPDEAFLVKCDRDTNPQEFVDQGIVTAQVAFAPLKPAEFVVIQISQKALVN